MGRKQAAGQRGGLKDRFSEQAVSGRKAAARRKQVAVADVDLGDSDSDLEQQGRDAFQEKRDKVSLHVSDSEEEDSELEQGVMDLDGGSEEEATSDEDDGDEDVEDVLEEEILRGGKLSELARHAKQLGQELKLQQGEDDDLDVSAAKKKRKAADEDEDEAPLAWGANKRQYYDDGSEEAEDEEEAREHEAEVRRMQREAAKKTAATDYGLDEEDEGEDEDESDEDDEDEEDDTLEAAAKRAAQGAKPKSGGVAVETVAKQLDALTADDRAAALLADAPELAALIDDLTAALNDVRHRVGPLVTEVRAGKLATKEGLSYLEAKHLLLLQYAIHIVFYLLLKAEGRSVKDHPVINRLVEIRAYLEKIRPIDKQMSYQVNKLLRAAAAAQAADTHAGNGAAAAGAAGPLPEDVDEDELAAAPRPDQLVARVPTAAGQPAAATATATGAGLTGPEGAGGSAVGVYRPPKLNPVTMEDDAERKRAAKLSREDRRMLAEARRRAGRSEVVAELAAEVAGAPTELRTALPGFDSLGALRMRQQLEARAAEEEDAFIRVPLSREQAKALKAQRKAGFSTAAVMGDFADEVADLVGSAAADGEGPTAAGGGRSSLADVFSRQKVSQKFGGELSKPSVQGGDEDLPRRATLGERRARYDAIAAKRAARADFDDDGGADDFDYDAAPSKRQLVDAGRNGGKRTLAQLAGEEDDFYAAAKQAAAERKRARSETHRAPELLPPMEDPDVGDRARPISSVIQKNRGLTPHRRKDIKNPRKHKRMLYEKAQKRRGGAVQDGAKGRDTGHAAYGGEATGVKSRVTKSRRL